MSTHYTFRKFINYSICLMLLASSCSQKTSNEALVTVAIPIPTGCELPWADTVAIDFVAQLELATQTAHPVWPDYKLGDGAVVLNAGIGADSSQCLGLWQNGKLTDYLKTKDKPRLSTPLYGYHLNFKETTQPDHVLARISVQPNEISTWLNGKGIESAVLMPVDFPQFPFEIPALKKMQIAIHESFHVEVMLRYWLTGKGNWPAWDEQPDRKGVRQCYGLNAEVAAQFKEEKGTLVSLIEALLDKDKEAACQRANSYLELRQGRYDLLGDFTVQRADGSECDCKEAEMIMELEEGLADYASWTMLYKTGLSSREKLIKRYNAQQNEPFYLTGAMLMHAMSEMWLLDEPFSDLIADMNASASIDEGGLLNLFGGLVEAYCDH